MGLFQQHGFHPRTDLGQNFLIDLNLVEYIVAQADLGPHDVVLEVGAGTGGMTAMMASRAGTVVAVEVDRNMHALATEAVSQFPNVTLLRTDALKNKNRLSAELVDVLQERLAADPQRRLKLVSNLPYNIATPVVSNLVASDLPWVRMVVTIQLELAQRMAAKPGSSQYGALSVWLQAQCRVKMLKKLRPSVFWPRPGVDSAIVQITPKPTARAAIGDRAFLQDFLRRLFHQRRKLLRSVLVGMYRKQLGKPEVDAVLKAMSLGGNARAEELDVKTLVELAERMRRAMHAPVAADDA
jgi:16S rRNA (adenine1518-N6/adenine1519-N6)-dimethyltransferase